MASVVKEGFIDAPADEVWAALRDFHAVHQRVAPGFLLALKSEDGDRIVTFANGLVARERFVAADERARRLVYTVVDGRPTHHNASAQVLPAGKGCRFVWITDVLPNELAPLVDAMMEDGLKVMQQTLSKTPAATHS